MKRASPWTLLLLCALGCRTIIIERSTTPREEPQDEPAVAHAESEPEAAPTAAEPAKQPEATAQPAALSNDEPATTAKDPAASLAESPAIAVAGKPKPREDKPRGNKPPKKPAHEHKTADAPTDSAKATVEPAAPVPSEPEPPKDQRTVKHIEVREEDSGVVSTIHLIDARGLRMLFAATSDSGIAQPNATCTLLDRFEVKPSSTGVYLLPDLQPCGERVVFNLSRVLLIAKIEKLGDDALANGRPGEAHFYFSLAVERYGKAYAADIARLRKKTQEAERALGVPEARGKPRTDAIKDLQNKLQLEPTGALDAKTQKALAGGIDRAEAFRRAAAVSKEGTSDQKAPRQVAPKKLAPKQLAPQLQRQRVK